MHCSRPETRLLWTSCPGAAVLSVVVGVLPRWRMAGVAVVLALLVVSVVATPIPLSVGKEAEQLLSGVNHPPTTKYNIIFREERFKVRGW